MLCTVSVLLLTGNLQELTVAGSSGSEQGMAALLTAACKSKRLHLLDVRGLQLRGKVRAWHWQPACLQPTKSCEASVRPSS